VDLNLDKQDEKKSADGLILLLVLNFSSTSLRISAMIHSKVSDLMVGASFLPRTIKARSPPTMTPPACPRQ
jgi:hypothetical protein